MAIIKKPFPITPAFNEMSVWSDSDTVLNVMIPPSYSGINLYRVPTVDVELGEVAKFDISGLAKNSFMNDRSQGTPSWYWLDRRLQTPIIITGASEFITAVNAVRQVGEDLNLAMTGDYPLTTNFKYRLDHRKVIDMYEGFPTGFTMMAKDFYTVGREKGGPSYWRDTKGYKHIFYAKTTPIENFKIANDVDVLLIDGEVVNTSDIAHITFGDDYLTVTSITGIGFLGNMPSLISVNLWGLQNITAIPAGFMMSCPSLRGIDLSVFKKITSIGLAAFRNAISLKTIILGDVDFRSITIDLQAFGGVPNVSTSDLYGNTQNVINAFKANLPNLYNWSEKVGMVPPSQLITVIHRNTGEQLTFAIDRNPVPSIEFIGLNAAFAFSIGEPFSISYCPDVEILPACTPEHPVYLRWINKDAGLDYYMFEARNWLVKSVDDVKTYDLFEPDTQLARGGTRRVSAKGIEELNIGADDIPYEDWAWITDILYSPVIEYWDRELGIWKVVNIVENTSAEWDSFATTGIFEMTITLPPKKLQL